MDEIKMNLKCNLQCLPAKKIFFCMYVTANRIILIERLKTKEISKKMRI